MSTHTTLEAASLDRKARLAQLKSLKRKQPESDTATSTEVASPSKRLSRSPSPPPQAIQNPHLSGRNYDPQTRAPKLGYNNAPAANGETLESQALDLATRTKDQADAEALEDKPLDLFKIQPKRPNWDLKRDLRRRMVESGLDARMDSVIRGVVRERLEGERMAQSRVGQVDGDGGMGGKELVEATKELERVEVEERRREELDGNEEV